MAKDFMFGFNYVYENNKFSKSNKFRTKSSDKSPIKIRLAKAKFWRSKRIEFKSWRKILGHIGFHKRALLIAENACQKNKSLQELVTGLKENPITQNAEIEKIAKQTKGFLDIDI